MGHIYWELKEIPLPEDAHINQNDGRVFIFMDDGKNVRSSKRKTIGRATSSTTMHPNDAFRYLYPNLWKEHYGDDNLLEHVIHSGMYALMLGIGYRTSLYPLLVDSYGPLYANAIMDFSMYSIKEKSDVAQTYESSMSGQILFSKKNHSDSWLSDFFRNKMTEEQNYKFRDAWLKRCKEEGVSKVWISIDGSNNNCEVQKCSLSEKGKAKSGKNVNIVSYIHAVSAEDGSPVTYFVNNGGKVDSKALQKMMLYIKGHDIGIEGVILDRGFCTHDVFELLNNLNCPYVVMLKSDTYAHTKMLEEYGETIRFKVEYAVDGKGLFGISEKKKLFSEHQEEAYVSLYYDGSNGTGRAITLIGKVMKAMADIKDQINKGNKPAMPDGMGKYISIEEKEGNPLVYCNYDKWQKDVDAKGFCSIASSLELGAAETNRIYHLRDASETQYMIMKSQLGYDVTRVHYTEGVENKHAICFIASIIRAEILKACSKLNLSTNQMIREIDRLELILLPNNIYTAVHDESKRQKELLAEFDIWPVDLNEIAKDYNQRLTTPIISQVHAKPKHDESNSKRKRGRPVGSGAKKEKEKKNAESVRKPGRPKGSKNKKTVEREPDANVRVEEKREPGRPKGSKNKPKDSAVIQERRSRGRPKGSKNKKTENDL